VKNSRRVYSTDAAAAPSPERAPGPDRPAVSPPGRGQRPPADGIVRILLDRSRGSGKVVTVVHGLPERGARLEARAGELRRLCAAGGARRGDVVEVQGDHRERVAAHLRGEGHRVKLAGG
jgi:translation initiation factor 1